MIPAGYMAKRVERCTERLDATDVVDIFSVSGCISKNFADYISFWRHNGYWLFNSPQIITVLAEGNSVDLAGTSLFFYEVYDREFDAERQAWVTFEPEPSFKTEVVVPRQRELVGFDIVTFSARTSPECSPLSCNSLANRLKTNRHCLLATLNAAREAIESGLFENAEPGPYRIFAVYSAEWPRRLAEP